MIRKSEKKTMVCLGQKGEKCGEIVKRSFLKIAGTTHQASSTEAAYSEHSMAIHSISMAGYVTTETSLSAANSQHVR